MPGAALLVAAGALITPPIFQTVEVCGGLQPNIGWGEGFREEGVPCQEQSILFRIQTFNLSGNIVDIDPGVVSVEDGGSSRGLGESGRFLIGSILQDQCLVCLPPPPVLKEICEGLAPNLGPILETVEIC
jgi:hypothetical protein